MHHLSGLPDLQRRMSRKLDVRKGMMLSYADLRLIVLCGSYGTLVKATNDEVLRTISSGAEQAIDNAYGKREAQATRPPRTRAAGTGRDVDEALAAARRAVGLPD